MSWRQLCFIISFRREINCEAIHRTMIKIFNTSIGKKLTLITLLASIFLSCNKESVYINLPAYGPEQLFYALSNNNEITAYNAKDVRTQAARIAVTGLATAENLVAIDFRPATGELYGVTSSSKLYVIDVITGATRTVSTTAFAPAIDGTIASMDFNPTADRIRIVTNTGQNLRINPETGQVTNVDPNITGSTVTGVAHDNNYAGAASTVLYDIDAVAGQLLKQDPPNSGTLVAVGSLGANLGNFVSFDIAPDSKKALAVGIVGDSTKLFTIDLASGKATLAGKFIRGVRINSIAIPTNPVAYAVDINQNLLSFDPTNTKSTIYSKPLTGLQTGETIYGIDMRPINGQLYALGSTNRLYTINVGTGALTQLGTSTFSTPLNGTSFGFDFDPITGLIRVVSNTRQQLEIDPITAAVTGRTAITPTSATPSAIAYNNNFSTTTATTLFAIDHGTDQLYSLVPTTGVLTAIGELKVDIGSANGFDVSPNNLGFGIFTVGTKTSIYAVSLTSGLSTYGFDLPRAITGFAVGLRF